MNKDLIKLGIDGYRGSVLNYSQQESSEVIRRAFVDLIGTDKPTARQFRRHRNDIFEIIEVVLDEVVANSFDGNPFFDQFVDYIDVNAGDTNEFYVEDRTMLSVARLADGHWDLRRQKLDIGDSFTVPVETYGVSIEGDFMRFLAGRIDWVRYIDKVEEAMRLKVATEIYTNFMGTVDYLPAEFKASGVFEEDAMLELVQHARVANNYAPVVIAGTQKALKSLLSTYTGTASLMSNDMKNQLNQQGVLESWNGVPLLEIPQVYSPNSFDFAVDDEKLMVLPANTKPIKFVREGESMIREISDGTTNMDMSMEYTFLTKFGIGVIFNNLYGIYDLA